MHDGPDIAAVAASIGDGTRATVLTALLAALSRRDVAAIESVLADDVELIAEGDDALYGPRQAIAGRARIAAALVALTRRSERVERLELVTVDGRVALVLDRRPRPGFAARLVILAEPDPSGRVTRLRALLRSAHDADEGLAPPSRSSG